MWMEYSISKEVTKTLKEENTQSKAEWVIIRVVTCDDRRHWTQTTRPFVNRNGGRRIEKAEGQG